MEYSVFRYLSYFVTLCAAIAVVAVAISIGVLTRAFLAYVSHTTVVALVTQVLILEKMGIQLKIGSIFAIALSIIINRFSLTLYGAQSPIEIGVLFVIVLLSIASGLGVLWSRAYVQRLGLTLTILFSMTYSVLLSAASCWAFGDTILVTSYSLPDAQYNYIYLSKSGTSAWLCSRDSIAKLELSGKRWETQALPRPLVGSIPIGAYEADESLNLYYLNSVDERRSLIALNIDGTLESLGMSITALEAGDALEIGGKRAALSPDGKFLALSDGSMISLQSMSQLVGKDLDLGRQLCFGWIDANRLARVAMRDDAIYVTVLTPHDLHIEQLSVLDEPALIAPETIFALEGSKLMYFNNKMYYFGVIDIESNSKSEITKQHAYWPGIRMSFQALNGRVLFTNEARSLLMFDSEVRELTKVSPPMMVIEEFGYNSKLSIVFWVAHDLVGHALYLKPISRD